MYLDFFIISIYYYISHLFTSMIKKMKLVLLKPIRTLGKAGDIVEVAPGYARNYLLPQKVSAIATDELIASLNEKKKQLEKEQRARVAAYQKWIDSNQGLKLFYVKEANDTGKLFGSITSSDILSDLAKKFGLDASHAIVDLSLAIKELGKFDLNLVLADELSVNVHVVVVRNENELLDANTSA